MNEALLNQWCEEFLARLAQDQPPALLIGEPPAVDLGYRYVHQGEYGAVVIGSLSAADLLHFHQEQVYRALLQGLPVYLVEAGLEHRKFVHCPNRVLWAKLLAAERQLQQLGIQFVGNRERQRLITADEARRLRQQGRTPPAGCRMTPLAQEILEGKP